jgi:hypothetical protein
MGVTEKMDDEGGMIKVKAVSGWRLAVRLMHDPRGQKPDWMLWIHFQVSGLGHRVPGSGVLVRVQVPGLIPESVPVPVPAAET